MAPDCRDDALHLAGEIEVPASRSGPLWRRTRRDVFSALPEDRLLEAAPHGRQDVIDEPGHEGFEGGAEGRCHGIRVTECRGKALGEYGERA